MDLEIHGHRGFRAKWPENTLQGFLAAIDAGVSAIELDVLVSADRRIVVSHEPWMSHKICLCPDGKIIAESEEKSHNIYRMVYSLVKRYDCGKANPYFPEQTAFRARKPLLREVVQAAEARIVATGKQIIYNIEIKSSAEEEGEYYPAPAEYMELLLKDILNFGLPGNRFLLQSFDVRILQQIRKRAPEFTLGLLVETPETAEESVARLGFLPEYFNPNYTLINKQMLDYCVQNNLKILPWTVNSETDMRKLLTLGVTGLITDFPDLAANVCANFTKQQPPV